VSQTQPQIFNFFAKGASDWVWKKHINIILL
jgi:hypothetical protein